MLLEELDNLIDAYGIQEYREVIKKLLALGYFLRGIPFKKDDLVKYISKNFEFRFKGREIDLIFQLFFSAGICKRETLEDKELFEFLDEDLLKEVFTDQILQKKHLFEDALRNICFINALYLLHACADKTGKIVFVPSLLRGKIHKAFEDEHGKFINAKDSLSLKDLSRYIASILVREKSFFRHALKIMNVLEERELAVNIQNEEGKEIYLTDVLVLNKIISLLDLESSKYKHIVYELIKDFVLRHCVYLWSEIINGNLEIEAGRKKIGILLKACGLKEEDLANFIDNELAGVATTKYDRYNIGKYPFLIIDEDALEKEVDFVFEKVMRFVFQ